MRTKPSNLFLLVLGVAMALSPISVRASISSSVSGEVLEQASGASPKTPSLQPAQSEQSLGSVTSQSAASPLALSVAATLSAPSVNNLDASEVVPKTKRKLQGYTLRNQFSAGLRLEGEESLSAVVDLTQPYYGTRSGEVIFNDPQLRYGSGNMISYRGQSASLRTPVFFSYYIPVSTLSRSLDQVGAVSATAIPIVRLGSFPVFASSVLTSKVGGFITLQNRMVFAVQYLAGLQANWEASSKLTPFSMGFLAGAKGADLPMTDEGISSYAARSGVGDVFGVILGVKYKPLPNFSLTPRYATVVGMPLKRGTLALNAYWSFL